MIGICDVSVQAANPNMPLYPLRAFVNSPSSLRIRNVPKKIGDWNISNVQLVVAYPDNTVKTVECKLIGNVWVGTVAGSSITGRCENGYTVFASGNDENGNPVSNYALGKGLVEILEADTELKPGANIKYVRIFDEEPETPKDGDVWQISGAWYIYQDGQSWPIGDDSGLIGQLSTELSTAQQDIESLSTSKQDVLTQPQISAIDSVVDERTTVFTMENGPARMTVSADVVGELNLSSIPDIPFYRVCGVKIGTAVTSIADSIFSTKAIDTLTIPNTVRQIGNRAFMDCHELRGTLVIPDSVESIGSWAFAEANNLDTIEVPSSVKTIGDQAFLASASRIIFKGRTIEEVSAMQNYPWGYDEAFPELDNTNRVTVYATEKDTTLSSVFAAWKIYRDGIGDVTNQVAQPTYTNGFGWNCVGISGDSIDSSEPATILSGEAENATDLTWGGETSAFSQVFYTAKRIVEKYILGDQTDKPLADATLLSSIINVIPSAASSSNKLVAANSLNFDLVTAPQDTQNPTLPKSAFPIIFTRDGTSTYNSMSELGLREEGGYWQLEDSYYTIIALFDHATGAFVAPGFEGTITFNGQSSVNLIFPYVLQDRAVNSISISASSSSIGLSLPTAISNHVRDFSVNIVASAGSYTTTPTLNVGGGITLMNANGQMPTIATDTNTTKTTLVHFSEIAANTFIVNSESLQVIT